MKVLLFISILFLSITTQGQYSEVGIPLSWDYNLSNENIKGFNLSEFEIQDEGTREKDSEGAESLVFANSYFLNKGTDNGGDWIESDDGSRIWRMRIFSEGAYSLNFTFNHFDIPIGSKVFVYSDDHSILLGAFTYKNIKKSGILPVAPIAGESIIIEYNEPENAPFEGFLNISYVGHDFLGVFGNKDGQFGVSGECNVDINCPEGADWQIEKKAICRMVIDNTFLCTGALLNNALQNADPFILSANHCISSEEIANNTVFVFNYESSSCKGPDGSVSQSISGAELLATKNNNQGFLDFSLLKLSAKVPISYEPYFLGWDSREEAATSSACIHHPWGDVKKISIDNHLVAKESYDGFGYDPNSFWKVFRWDAGMTQGGSSGSPLINQDRRIIGTLSGGDAHQCDDDPVNDYFQMFSVAFDKYNDNEMQLKYWLDPTGSGVVVMDGFKPELEDVDNLIQVGNFDVNDPLAFFVSNDGGYVAGNNAYHDKKKAEYYDQSKFGSRNAITSVLVAFAYATGDDNTMIELEILNEENDRPGELLGSAFMDLKTIKENADSDWVKFVFDEPLIVNNSIFASIILPDQIGDTVAIMNIDTATVDENTAWELNTYDQWWPYSNSDFSWNMEVAHFMYLEIGQLVSIADQTLEFASFNVFPNPTNESFKIQAKVSQEPIIACQVYNSLGSIVYSYYSDNNFTEEINIDVMYWHKGMYIVQVQSNNRVFTYKLMVE